MVGTHKSSGFWLELLTMMRTFNGSNLSNSCMRSCSFVPTGKLATTMSMGECRRLLIRSEIATAERSATGGGPTERDTAVRGVSRARQVSHGVYGQKRDEGRPQAGYHVGRLEVRLRMARGGMYTAGGGIYGIKR